MFPIRLADYKTSALRAAKEALDSEGGKVIREICEQMVSRAVNELVAGNENDDKNRGRLDAYTNLVSLSDQIGQELKKASHSETNA